MDWPKHREEAPPNTTFRATKGRQFGAGLCPFHSPLLRASRLFSFPPLINMLKFGGSPCLLSGRKLRGRRREDKTRDSARRKRLARPGTSPRVRAVRRRQTSSQLEATLRQEAEREPNAQDNQSWEGCKTDPEPDMGGGRASARNMRSKCRCSYVLQFTFRRAVCCVLHRPPSQVIHCAVLSLKTKAVVATRTSRPTTDSCHSFHQGESDKLIPSTGETL